MTALDQEVDPAVPVAAAPRPRRGRTVRWVAVAVGLALALFLGALASADGGTEAPSPLLGRPAPAIDGPLVWPSGEEGTGAPRTLQSLRGRYVVVNFFATWCVPCQQEHDDLVRFARRHDLVGDAAVIAVVFDDSREQVRKFFSERGSFGSVVEDDDAKVDYGVRGVPESFLVSPDGVVLARIVGGVTADGVERLLQSAKSGRR